MSEDTMPASEVSSTNDSDRNEGHYHYELAFHLLPTVADGEVETVCATLKELLQSQGAEVTESETPQRFELLYPMQKSIEGKKQWFKSSHFGWMRFTADASSVEEITSELKSHQSMLRCLIVKLTKEEEKEPFRFFEMKSVRKEDERADEDVVDTESNRAKDATIEVQDAELDESIEKITHEQKEDKEAE